jgi:hypothetical protein
MEVGVPSLAPALGQCNNFVGRAESREELIVRPRAQERRASLEFFDEDEVPEVDPAIALLEPLVSHDARGGRT